MVLELCMSLYKERQEKDDLSPPREDPSKPTSANQEVGSCQLPPGSFFLDLQLLEICEMVYFITAA